MHRHDFARSLRAMAVVLLLTPAGIAAELTVERGLQPYQVLQRDNTGNGSANVSGGASESGQVLARIMKQDEVVVDWQEVGTAVDGAWSGSIEGVPTGGEYRVELSLHDDKRQTIGETVIEHVLVGDLWVLAGQSNMQGHGNFEDVEEPTELVHSFDMADHWLVGEEPLHALLEAVDPVHWRGNTDAEQRTKQAQAMRANPTKGTGLGLPFAKFLVERTGVPIGLVPCAHGGTSMDQWNPELKSAGGDSLYGAMIRRIGVVGGHVRGVLWYQGESDARPGSAEEFAGKFERFIGAVRADTGQPDLAFYYVQLGRFAFSAGPAGWHTVREAQRVTPQQVPGTVVVPAIDLSLDDLIHISTPGLKRLGVRLAKVACREQFGQTEFERGPQLTEVSYEKDARQIRVRYEDVNGQLSPSRHIAGYSLRNSEGKQLPLIYDAQVDDADRGCVLLRLVGDVPPATQLWYGYGLDPYCNLVDAEDMAAPAFGPWPLTAAE